MQGSLDKVVKVVSIQLISKVFHGVFMLAPSIINPVEKYIT